MSVGKTDSNFEGLLQLYRYPMVWICEHFQKLSLRPNNDNSLTFLMTMQKQLSVQDEFKVIADLNVSSAVSNISPYKLIIMSNIVWSILIHLYDIFLGFIQKSTTGWIYFIWTTSNDLNCI